MENACIQYDVCNFILKVFVIYPEAKIGLNAPPPVKGEWDILREDQKISNLMAFGMESLEDNI